MISVYNSVTRRPHVPREKALRRILISQGFDIDLESPPRSGPSGCGEASEGDGDDEMNDVEDSAMEENSESECFTDDESLMMEDEEARKDPTTKCD